MGNSNIRTRLIPVPKWNHHHDWPPPGGLRHLIFHADSNGFSRVVRRIGRTVLIDESAFFEWVEQLNQAAKQPPALREG